MLRINANPALKKAQEERAIAYISNLSEEEFIKQTAREHGLLNNTSSLDEVQRAIYERIDQIILRKIQEFDGIPSARVLSRIKGFFGPNLILARLSSNSSLKAAQETQGLKYINELPITDLVKQFAQKNGLVAESAGLFKTKARIYERLDLEFILSTIQSLTSVPSVHSLSKVEGMPHANTIQLRINANPILFQAYYEKKGLTVDQAVELALDREDERPEAVADILSKRLKQLFAFREVLGLVKYFSDVFDHAKQVLEVSLYPQPLKQALEMEGKTAQAVSAQYVDLKQARADQTKVAVNADVVLLQGIHRMTSEQFNAVLFEIHKTLPPGAVVFATYSNDYQLAEFTPDALAQRGFVLDVERSGQLKIHAPETEVLTELGVTQDDLSRVRAKLSGSSNVLCLTRSEVLNQETVIPALEKISSEDSGKPVLVKNTEITAPEGAIPHIDASLTTSLRIASSCEPFILTVMDGETRVAEIGYGANPGLNNQLEIDVRKGHNSLRADLRAQAQEILKDPSKRGFIVPRSITAVSLSKLKV